MALGNSWDKMNGSLTDIQNSANDTSTRPYRRLTKEEKRQRAKEEYYSREGYRRFGAKEIPYSSIAFRNAIFTVFSYIFIGLYLSGVIVATIAFAIHGGDVARFLAAVLLVAVVWIVVAVRRSKRKKFVKKLKKLCREKGIHLYENSPLMKNMRRPSGVCDFTVETKDCLYDVMFFPSPKRLVIMRFLQPDVAQVMTRVVKSRLSLALGLREKIKDVSYAFEGSKVSSKKAIKVLLMNPAPYSMQAYDKRENKVVETGSGAEFFGYTAYTGSGFLGVLDRET